MRKLTILISILLILSCMTACGSTDKTQPTEDGILTEIKDDDGNLTGYERKYHNDNGDVTRWDVYDGTQTYLYYVLYDYDDNGRLSSETKYKADGIAEDRYTYTYDDNGILSEKAYELPHGEAEIYRYDADGNETERLYYGTDEKLYQREVMENGKWVAYDADGKQIDS